MKRAKVQKVSRHPAGAERQWRAISGRFEDAIRRTVARAPEPDEFVLILARSIQKTMGFSEALDRLLLTGRYGWVPATMKDRSGE